MANRSRQSVPSGGRCRSCGRECASAALVSCPQCGGAIGAANTLLPRGWLAVPEVRHPRQYTWFVFLSALDVMLTWVVLLLGGLEVNPLAAAVVQHGGLTSLVIFKFCLVIFVVIMCEWVTRRSPRAGFKLAEWSVAITAIPVMIGFVTLAALLA